VVAASGIALLLAVGSAPGKAIAQVDNRKEIHIDVPVLPSWAVLGASPITPRRVFPDALTVPAGVPEAVQFVAGPTATVRAPAPPSGAEGLLADGLLADGRLTLTPAARADLASGVVDSRLVVVLAGLLQRHSLSILVFRTGHSVNIAGTDVVSNHFRGRAADVSAVDGEPVTPASEAARQVVLELIATSFPGGRPEIGQPWADLVGNGVFSNVDHLNHLHIGLFDAEGGRGP